MTGSLCSRERATNCFLVGHQSCSSLLEIEHQFFPNFHVLLVLGAPILGLRFTSSCCSGFIMRYLELLFYRLEPLVEIGMFAKFVITKPAVVSLRAIVCCLSLVLIHVPGFRREGAVYPGFLDVVDHDKSKLGLTIIKFLGENVQILSSFV